MERCWQIPTPDFLAALPRDPRQLYERLCVDSPPSDWPGYVGPLVYGLDALRTGRIPADLRAALYQALLLLPGITITKTATNSDGATAVMLLLDHKPERTEVFLDPDTGHFTGERRTLITSSFRGPFRGLKAGTVLRSSAVTMAVVDEIGVLPNTSI